MYRNDGDNNMRDILDLIEEWFFSRFINSYNLNFEDLLVGPNSEFELFKKDNSNNEFQQKQEIYSEIFDETNKLRVLIDMCGRNLDDIKFEATDSRIKIFDQEKEISRINLPSIIKPKIQSKDIRNGIITIEVEKINE